MSYAISEKFNVAGLHEPAFTEVIPTISRAIDAEARARVALTGSLPGDVSRIWQERIRSRQRAIHRIFSREDD